MKSPARLKTLARVVMLGSAFAASSSQASAAPDTWITTRVKLALFTANVANATMVHVDTINGRVLLYGKVTSTSQKEKATGIVRGIAGVTDVANMLEVVNLTDLNLVDASDDRIREDVQKRLDTHPTLVARHIHVKSVNNGAVLLAGDALGPADHLHAVECASSVAGVRSVNSEIESANELALEDAMPTQAGVNEAAREGWLVGASKMRFLADPDVPALEVGVNVFHNVVTLFGIVPSQVAKAAAEADVLKVDPAVTVKNELQVVSATYKRLVDAKDDLVKQAVEKALGSRKELSTVVVEVKNGVVRLTGTVGSAWQRLNAGLIARGTAGVRAVEDDLKV